MFLGSDGLTHQSTMSEYCLRWNNHQPNLVAVFSELLHSEALVDVTLATDGHFIHAHKLVLSACSMYFKDLFASNPCKHPIVILKDIKIDDLKTVIDFIYRGEVNVSQDRLQDVLKTAESLRIKGLTENPRSIDDVASQGQRLSSSSLGSQTARQVSSFSEQSLSIEGDDDKVETTSSTGPKKRKLPPSMGSSESVYDNDSENNDEKRIKDEPTDEKVLPRDRSRETDSDHSVSAVAGAMIMLQQQGIEGGEEASSQGPSGGDPGTSASHAQGISVAKRRVLQRQQGINKDGGNDERRTELASRQEDPLDIRDMCPRDPPMSCQGELIIPDPIPGQNLVTSTMVVPSSQQVTTLLQVPGVTVGSPPGLGPPSLHKQHSHPGTVMVLSTPPGPVPITKQQSHPETQTRLSVPSSQHHSSTPGPQGPPQITKQRTHTGVVTSVPTHSSDKGSSSSGSGTGGGHGGQHIQVIPKPIVKQKPSTTTHLFSSLRPIQPKPSSEGGPSPAAEPTQQQPTKKEVPRICLTTSEDGGNGHSPVPVPRLARALSEEPIPLMRLPGGSTGSSDMVTLSPGPSTLVQSVSQDTGFDAASQNPYLSSGATLTKSHSTSHLSTVVKTPTSLGHCPTLRIGHALGCNFCWNSTDAQGRVQRRKTKYHCPECRTNLCIVPCFHEYHKQMEKAEDTQKQINKYLTKNDSM